MQKEGYAFLASMRTDRKAYCQVIDERYHKERAEKQRKLERRIQRQSTSFETVRADDDNNEIEKENISNHQDDLIDSEDEFECGQPASASTPAAIAARHMSTSMDTNENPFSLYPVVHVRKSNRLLNDDIVHAFAELDGHVDGYVDCVVALKANRIFKQNWQVPVEKDRISKYDAESTEENTAKLMKS